MRESERRSKGGYDRVRKGKREGGKERQTDRGGFLHNLKENPKQDTFNVLWNKTKYLEQAFLKKKTLLTNY